MKLNGGDFEAENLRVWEKTIRELFPVAIPNHCLWQDRESIISILHQVASVKDLNHTLFPIGGGHDIIGVEKSSEKDCLELHTPHSVRIIKPKLLEFNYFPEHLEWTYFRLETAPLKPITPDIEPFSVKEKLVEIKPGYYGEKEIWEKGYLGYDEKGMRILLPQSARLVSRYFKGSFVIFAKSSPYHKNHVTYDARHDQMDRKEFRQYIENCIVKFEEEG